MTETPPPSPAVLAEDLRALADLDVLNPTLNTILRQAADHLDPEESS